jgi:ABC-2 type transport system permease protein
MSGKIVGIIGIGLTQLLVWAGAAALLILLGRRWLPWLEAIRLDPAYLGLVGLIMIPSFIMVAALMAAAGATVTDERESQQMSGLFTLPVVAPFWFTYLLMSNPNGPLALALSYFPLTAPVALTMRAGFTYIPPWQLGFNLFILFLFALGSLWLAGRAFHLGLLRYGQRVSWRELFGRQPGRKEVGNV